MKNYILIVLIGITIGIFQVFLSSAKEIDGSVEVSRKEPSKSTTMGESVINDGTKRSFTVIPMYDKKTEALDVNSISCKGDGGATWIRPDGSLLTAVEIPTLDSAGDFAVIIKGAIHSTVKGTRFSPAPKGWKFDGIGEYHIKCKYGTVDNYGKCAWIPATKMADFYKNCPKNGVLFTISTPIDGNHFSDVFADMDAVAPVYPPYQGEAVDPNKKMWGCLLTGYVVKKEDEGSLRGCPVCKSPYSFTDTIRHDVNITCEIKLPAWTNVLKASEDAQAEWKKLIASILTHEEAHLEDFNNQFLKIIYAERLAFRACIECDKAGYTKLVKEKEKTKTITFQEYNLFLKKKYEEFGTFTKRVETEFPSYPIDLDEPIF